MKQNSYLVAITGDIASGKSKVLEYLKTLNYEVIDCDDVVAELYSQKDVKKHIADILEIEDYENIDIKNELKKRNFFGDQNLRNYVESYIHPKVYEYIRKMINDKKEIFFIEIPLLFESYRYYLDSDIKLNEIWFIYANFKVRLKRLMEREKIDHEGALKRMVLTVSDAAKKQKSDYVFENNAAIESLQEEIDRALERINKIYEKNN